METQSKQISAMFDSQIFEMQRFGGISRYFSELLSMFIQEPKYGVRIPTAPGGATNSYVRTAQQVMRRSRTHALSGRLPRRLRAFTAPIADRPQMRRSQLVHHTYYDPRYLPPSRDTASITTVHDMMPEMFPQHFPRGNPHLEKQRFCRRADAIICVSETTRNDLERIYGALDVPTIVVPLGVSDHFFTARGSHKPDRHRKPYVLFVGSRSRYKGFPLLLESFAMEAFGSTFDLLAVGGGAFRSEELSLMERLGIRANVHQINVTDDVLPKVYAGAEMFVFPSMYEGFGLPTLEAMASDCPTIVSSAPALQEVSGGASLTFEAGNPYSLASAMRTIGGNPQTRLALIESGSQRVRHFSWHSTANLTAKAYRLALD